MKRNNKCVKCGSIDLFRVPTVPGEGPHLAVGERVMHAVGITQFVCGACGYIETWVNGSADLDKLRQEYAKK